MLNRLIELSLRQRILVAALTAMVIIYGLIAIPKMDVDVLPDLNRPVVTVMTEAHGMAPEETEALVSFPIETMMNGATGVQRVRSASSAGFSIVFVEFDWGMDIFRARQIVNEKLQLAQARLPEGSVAFAGPASRTDGSALVIRGAPLSIYTPMLQVKTDMVRAKLIETPWLGYVNHMSMVASKAARVVVAAGGSSARRRIAELLDDRRKALGERRDGQLHLAARGADVAGPDRQQHVAQ